MAERRLELSKTQTKFPVFIVWLVAHLSDDPSLWLAQKKQATSTAILGVSEGKVSTAHIIMTGLDPGIFPTAQKEDARVKRGHDEEREVSELILYPNFRCLRSCMG